MKVLATPENKKVYTQKELNQLIGFYYLGFLFKKENTNPLSL